MEITPYSPDNLAELLSEAQDKNAAPGYEMTNLTHDQMLNYAPASMVPSYPNPSQYPPLAGFGAAQSFSPIWYILAAAALGYIVFVREPSHY